MTPTIAAHYQHLRRLGHTRAHAAQLTRIPYAQAWALDQTITPHRSTHHV